MNQQQWIPQQQFQVPAFQMPQMFQMPFQMPNQMEIMQQMQQIQNNDQMQQQPQLISQQINLSQSIMNAAPFMMQGQYPNPQFLIEQVQNMQLNPAAFQQSQHVNAFYQSPSKMQNNGQQSRQQKLQQECQDYNCGFCSNGPACPYLHVKKSEVQRPKKVPEWYIQKVSQHFKNNGMTDRIIILELLNSVLMNKLQDTQSINFSFGGTFSDVMSERSGDPFGHRDIQMQIEKTRPIIRGRTRFFIVKSFNFESIQLSIQHGIWATSAGPTKKLTNAFKGSDHVILIFSVNESRCFQGFALMDSEPDPNIQSDLFMNDKDSPIQFADNFKVRWIITCDFQFRDLEHFPFNPMNENLPIKQSKNGQELPFKLGNYLCYTLYNQNDPKKQILCPLEIINAEFNTMQANQQTKPMPKPMAYQSSGLQGSYNNGNGIQQNSNQQQLYLPKKQQKPRIPQQNGGGSSQQMNVKQMNGS